MISRSSTEALRLHEFYCAGCSEYGGHSIRSGLTPGGTTDLPQASLARRNVRGNPEPSRSSNVGASGKTDRRSVARSTADDHRLVPRPQVLSQDAGFDSPPPPSIDEQMMQAGRTIRMAVEAYNRHFGHVHTPDCMDC